MEPEGPRRQSSRAASTASIVDHSRNARECLYHLLNRRVPLRVHDRRRINQLSSGAKIPMRLRARDLQIPCISRLAKRFVSNRKRVPDARPPPFWWHVPCALRRSA